MIPRICFKILRKKEEKRGGLASRQRGGQNRRPLLVRDQPAQDAVASRRTCLSPRLRDMGIREQPHRASGPRLPRGRPGHEVASQEGLRPAPAFGSPAEPPGTSQVLLARAQCEAQPGRHGADVASAFGGRGVREFGHRYFFRFHFKEISPPNVGLELTTPYRESHTLWAASAQRPMWAYF